MSRRRPLPSPTAVSVAHHLEDAVVVAVVRRTAGAVCRRPGFTGTDRPDIEQALFAAVHRARPRFRLGRGAWRAFAATVIARRAASLARDRQSPKRATRVVPLARTDPARDRRRPRPSDDPAETVPLALTVQAVLSAAPAALRALAERLMTGEALAPAAATLGIPRSTARGQMARLRRRFEDAGLWAEV